MSGFNHENLDCYHLALEVARWVAKAPFGANDADLRDQGVRASQSIVLNIAEGCARGGRAEKNHFRIALGSAAETCAVLDLVADRPGFDSEITQEQQNKLRRVGAMLHRLAR
jgi:four helix bundle protein